MMRGRAVADFLYLKGLRLRNKFNPIKGEAMKKLIGFVLLVGFCGGLQAGCCSCSSGCCGSPKKTEEKVSRKEVIKQEYGKVAEGIGCGVVGGGCCGGGTDLSKYLGYSKEELDAVADANLGLGCGHPVSLGEINEGDTVLDLGSGAGIDCFLASRKVGETGHVIGVDMTESMIKKARENATSGSFDNVEFRLGDIENLPVENDSVDIIISNCVINLTDDKFKVFQEANRVLKPGGKMYVSDVVLLSELSEGQKNDTKLLCACVGGALLKSDYLKKLEDAGFAVEIVGEDREISRTWFGHDDLPIESLKFIASKK